MFRVCRINCCRRRRKNRGTGTHTKPIDCLWLLCMSSNKIFPSNVAFMVGFLWNWWPKFIPFPLDIYLLILLRWCLVSICGHLRLLSLQWPHHWPKRGTRKLEIGHFPFYDFALDRTENKLMGRWFLVSSSSSPTHAITLPYHSVSVDEATPQHPLDLGYD